MGWRQRIERFLVRKLGWLLITGIARLNRVSLGGGDAVRALQAQGRPLIFLFWHRHILFVIHQFRCCGARPLVSLSSDGERVAAVAEEFGMRPVRGSSSRGGARAFLELARLVREERAPVLITADGPKGPARQVKAGAAQLAARTGAWIVPVSWAATRAKVLEKSWDRFLVPLPFGRIHFAYGEPLAIAGDADAGGQATLDMLSARLDRLQMEVEAALSGT